MHLKDGSVRCIDGNRNHPVNCGVLCAEGSAGITRLQSSARLTKPLRRIGPTPAAAVSVLAALSSAGCSLPRRATS